MELKISESEIKIILESLERILDKSTGKICAEIKSAADRIGEGLDSLDNTLEDVGCSIDGLADAVGTDDIDDDNDEDYEADYYIEEITDDSRHLRIIVVTDDTDHVHAFRVIENVDGLPVADDSDVQKLYRDYNTEVCSTCDCFTKADAIDGMNQLADDIEEGVYTLYRVNGGYDDEFVAIVTGSNHPAKRSVYDVVDYAAVAAGVGKSTIESDVYVALAGGNIEKICEGDLDTCEEVLRTHRERMHGGASGTDATE